MSEKSSKVSVVIIKDDGTEKAMKKFLSSQLPHANETTNGADVYGPNWHYREYKVEDGESQGDASIYSVRNKAADKLNDVINGCKKSQVKKYYLKFQISKQFPIVRGHILLGLFPSNVINS